jgi:hypothetical protein
VLKHLTLFLLFLSIIGVVVIMEADEELLVEVLMDVVLDVVTGSPAGTVRRKDM